MAGVVGSGTQVGGAANYNGGSGGELMNFGLDNPGAGNFTYNVGISNGGGSGASPHQRHSVQNVP